MTNQEIYDWTQKIGVFVLALAFLAGCATYWFGIKVNNENDAKALLQEKTIAEINLIVEQEKLKRIEAEDTIAAINLKVEEEKQKRIEAENGFLELQNKAQEINLTVQQEAYKRAAAETRLIELQNKVHWRHIDINMFATILKQKNKGTAEIVYLKDDNEAYNLADNIWMGLSAAGWTAKRPISGLNNNESTRPFAMREGGIYASDTPTLIISFSNTNDHSDKDSPLSALVLAFKMCDMKIFETIPYKEIQPPAGVIRIIVGSRF